MIVLEAVSKVFRSRLARKPVAALSDFSLSIPSGEVLGIAGPNGAGKSTMISLILGYLRPTSGTVLLDGRAPRPFVQSRGVSYLTELVAFPPRWTVESALWRLLALAGSPPHARGRMESALDATGLEEHRQKQVRQLSKGILQRLGLAQALLDDSEIVILDEPTHGLDPLWTKHFRDLVRSMRRPNRTILVASHNLDELERIADRVAILHQGRLQRIVTPGQGHGGSLTWRLVLGGATDESILLEAFPNALAVEGRLREFRVHGDTASVNAGIARVLQAGGQFLAMQAEQSGLEREFHAAITDPPVGSAS